MSRADDFRSVVDHGSQMLVARDNVDIECAGASSVPDTPKLRRPVAIARPSVQANPDVSLSQPLGWKDLLYREENRAHKPRRKFTIMSQVRLLLFSSWTTLILIPVVPAGFAVKYTNRNPIVTFAVNFVAIIPLGSLLETATEELVIRTGHRTGMFVVDVFGNTIQLIITIVALIKHQPLIVRTSLIGSVISNNVLLLGVCLFVGGINRIEQAFNPLVVALQTDFFVVILSALAIPTAFVNFASSDKVTGVKGLSRATSLLLLLDYGALLFFQFKSHRRAFESPIGKNRTRDLRYRIERLRGLGRRLGCGSIIADPRSEAASFDSTCESESEEPGLSILTAVATLLVCTVLIGFTTTFAVDSIDGLTQRTVLSQSFVGLILLPLLSCNLHALTQARKDNLDATFDITLNGSIQVMAFILPLAILIDWMRHTSELTLVFDVFQILGLGVSTILLHYIVNDGKSNWIEGLVLTVLYALIALNAWYTPDKVLRDT